MQSSSPRSGGGSKRNHTKKGTQPFSAPFFLFFLEAFPPHFIIRSSFLLRVPFPIYSPACKIWAACIDHTTMRPGQYSLAETDKCSSFKQIFIFWGGFVFPLLSLLHVNQIRKWKKGLWHNFPAGKKVQLETLRGELLLSEGIRYLGLDNQRWYRLSGRLAVSNRRRHARLPACGFRVKSRDDASSSDSICLFDSSASSGKLKWAARLACLFVVSSLFWV